MFSILIPTLNNFKYLKLSTESIQKISSFNNEILVHESGDFSNEIKNFFWDFLNE